MADEYVVSLAALALYDGDHEVTAEKINALLKASGNNDVAPYWPMLFAGLLKDNKIEKIVLSGGAGSAPAPAAPVGGAPVAGAKAAPEVAKKEKVVEEEVDALAGGMDMFGGGGDATGDY